jgi:2-iminobutanoate/2-iminopropanoate deaminase
LPFAFDGRLELFVDPQVFGPPEIYYNAARLDRSIALPSADYRRVREPAARGRGRGRAPSGGRRCNHDRGRCQRMTRVMSYLPLPQRTSMRVAIHSGQLAKPVGPFSPAVRGDGTLYVSGQVAQDPVTGRLAAGGVAEQTARALDNVRLLLEAAGHTLDDVMRVGVYLTDMKDFAAMNDVYAKYFRAPCPARTTVAVAALPLGAAVEIDVVAGSGAA